MRVGVLGVNHKSADLSLREGLARVCARRFSPGNSFHSNHSFVLLSTCNRTEIYFSSHNLAETHSYLLRVLRYDIECEFEHKLYSYFGYDCFIHLAKVTAGMDSAILAETEIQGQVKSAYESAKESSLLLKELHFLFQKSLKIGKEIRTLYPISCKKSSLEESILSVSHHHFEFKRDLSILFVGASEINSKVLRAFLEKGHKRITLCNRTEEHAHKFSSLFSINLLHYSNLDLWTEFDIVIVGTKSGEYLIGPKNIQTAKKQLLIDLSVPRNIDPKLDSYDHITLLNVDQIHSLDAQNRAEKKEFLQIEKKILEAVQAHMFFFSEKEGVRQKKLFPSRLVVHA